MMKFIKVYCAVFTRNYINDKNQITILQILQTKDILQVFERISSFGKIFEEKYGILYGSIEDYLYFLDQDFDNLSNNNNEFINRSIFIINCIEIKNKKICKLLKTIENNQSRLIK